MDDYSTELYEKMVRKETMKKVQGDILEKELMNLTAEYIEQLDRAPLDTTFKCGTNQHHQKLNYTGVYL